jgi:tetratricopeptide (TPR) repeat protein
MEKYKVEQLFSLVNSTISLLKFNESESYDGTIVEITSDPQGDYLTLYQHEDEKFYIKDIEEIYLHLEGHLPVYYTSLDQYGPDSFSYPPEYIEAFFDYQGQQVKMYGMFNGFYELTGTLSEIKIEEQQLVVDNYEVDLWRINMVFQIDENNQKYFIAVEDLSETFDEPLDNLYSMEDFDMLVGRKIRIKTMDPEIADEIVTVSGYSLAEGYSGDEVYHLELEEFPDHILEPSEIQFIYLIGDDMSETLVEPSGGSLYKTSEEDEIGEEELQDLEFNLESQYFEEFKNNILPELRPFYDGQKYNLLWLTFSEEEFKQITKAIKEWYVDGTPANFSKTINSSIKVFDSRLWKEWSLEKGPVAAGYNNRPYKNFPCLLIQNTSLTDSSSLYPNNFVFYNLSDIDKLNDDFGLGLNNYHLAIGRMYEAYAPDQIDPLDYYKSSIIHIQEFIKAYPKHIIALNSIGYNFYLLGKFDEALRFLNSALEINPEWLTPLANKIDVCIQLNQLDIATDTIDKVKLLEPNHGEWDWYMAKILEKKNDKQEARKFAELAIKKGFTKAQELLSNL